MVSPKSEDIVMPPYPGILPIEQAFDPVTAVKWMEGFWTNSFYLVGAYLLFLLVGQKVMRTRPRFQLTRPMILWNLGLALFSIFGAIRTVPELWFVLNRSKNGFHHSVCHTSWSHNKAFQLWLYLFIMSKSIELGDTVFIVLRKQKLIFLHWYHHVTVLLYCWYSYTELISTSRWFMATNFTIHAFMYSYYFLKAMKIWIPKQISVAITTAQIVQMVAGVVVNVHAMLAKRRGESCDVTEANISWSLIMYSTYFILFAKFFYDAYLARPVKAESKSSKGK